MKPEIDCSNYSIPELEEALATVNERMYPENKAALERELQARKDSGEFDRYMEAARSAQEKKSAKDLRFALEMRRAIGIYLIIAAIYSLAEVLLDARETPVGLIPIFIIGLFLVASFAGGIGLILTRTWGHWMAIAVLGLQLLKVQFDGFAYSILSLFSIYLYVAGGEFGISASFDSDFALAVGRSAPPWFGLNIFSVALIGFLFFAEEGKRQS